MSTRSYLILLPKTKVYSSTTFSVVISSTSSMYSWPLRTAYVASCRHSSCRQTSTWRKWLLRTCQCSSGCSTKTWFRWVDWPHTQPLFSSSTIWSMRMPWIPNRSWKRVWWLKWYSGTSTNTCWLHLLSSIWISSSPPEFMWFLPIINKLVILSKINWNSLI